MAEQLSLVDILHKAEKGDTEAQFYMGRYYMEGEERTADIARAIRWFEMAASGGHAEAKNYMGMFYYNGVTVEKDMEKAFSYFKEAAEKGSSSAALNVADCYENGDGTKQDYEMAFFWYSKAAEKGIAEAETSLGLFYEFGNVVEQNHQEAMRLFMRAAENGSIGAKYHLARHYYGKEDYHNALRCFKQAAEAGTLIFTEGELDANTGVYCIECAAPVYGPDGSLTAVAASDLYLDEMQEVLLNSAEEGECQLLVNQNGQTVLAPLTETFPMAQADLEGDLRESGNEFLAQIVQDAIQGEETGVRTGELTDGTYYVTASRIETTGWVLLSAFPQEIAMRPAVVLQEQSAEIQKEAALTYQEKTGKSRLTAAVLLALSTILMLAGALALGKRIVMPLNTITRRISQLREGNLEFKMEDAYRTGDEVEELAQSFASISHKTVEYLDTVKRVTAEKERIGTELSLATQIQAAMLPHIVPAFPDRKDFDILGSMDPAREVGGDFYDYFLVDPDHLCMVIADVSGKGVPAALFMMASKIILQSVAMMGNTPEQILTRANEAICSNNDAQMFVTVWLGILELSTGKLTAANAGHEYPVLMHPDGMFELFKDRHGFVIGGMEGVRYREYELQLEPGAKLFVYTDGVPEASDADQELFGTERMVDALNAGRDGTPQEILKTVRQAVDGFVKDAEQFDDLTMMCLEYKGPSA